MTGIPRNCKARRRNIVVQVLAALLLSGCILNKFSHLESNLQNFSGTSALTGTVLHRASDRTRIIVTAFQDLNSTPEFIYATRLLDENFFVFLVTPDKT